MNDKLKYIPEIDGLRAIAVILVVFYHLKIPFFSGFFRCRYFFCYKWLPHN